MHQHPTALNKISDGLQMVMQEAQIIQLVSANYPSEAVVVRAIAIDVADVEGTSESVGNARVECSFQGRPTIPECNWDHVAASLLQIAMNQAGKALVVACTDRTGIALKSISMHFMRPAYVTNVQAEVSFVVSEVNDRVLIDAEWTFHQEGKPFARASTQSLAIDRPPSGVRRGS